MKISIVSGSARSQSQSIKVARFIESQLAGHTTYLCSLANNPLPLWDEGVWSGTPLWQEKWAPIKQELQSSDAFIFVAPEWGGMVPAALKNFFLLCSAHEVGHKPGLIVSVSSTRNGAYPIAELRMSSYKNNRLCYIPEHLIVRDVEQVLNEGEPRSEDDRYIRLRLNYCLEVLKQYAEALGQVRKSGVIDHKTFPNGM